MDDKATAATCLRYVKDNYMYDEMESAIVAALEAARRDAGAATQRTIDAAFREGYEAALRAHADTLNARNEACNIKGIIDCTGEVPCVRRTAGKLTLTEDGVVIGSPYQDVWTIHGRTGKPYETLAYHASFRKCWSTESAAKAAMEGGK
jgi:hypothetical protein